MAKVENSSEHLSGRGIARRGSVAIEAVLGRGGGSDRPGLHRQGA